MCTWIELIFGMMIDTGLKFLSAVSAATLGSRSHTFRVYVLKFFRSSLLLYLWMDLVYTWYGNRYWSQIFSSSISSHDHNLGVKVTDFEFLC